MKLHDDIHNYYEKLVLDEVIKQKISESLDVDTLADFCCTVLNQLPPRYIRFEVWSCFLFTSIWAYRNGRTSQSSHWRIYKININEGGQLISSSLDSAPEHIKLAIDLIMLLEKEELESQVILDALEVVKNDFKKKLVQISSV